MRITKIINSEWLFTKKAKTAPVSVPEGWQELNLPYTWNGKDGQDGGNDYYRGVCWFAKSIKAEAPSRQTRPTPSSDPASL